MRSADSIHQHVGSSTVGLVQMDEDGDVRVYCTGIWVGADKILTANHCVEREEGSDPTDRVVYYVIEKEVHELGELPAALHRGTVMAYDGDNDLALIKAVAAGVPPHEVAELADELPAMGEHVLVVGHPKGAYWTYVEGTVAAYRKETPIGKAIQFNGTAWFGNSGGGLFDMEGHLLGVCSRLVNIPNMSLFVHLDSIKQFIKNSHVK